MSGANSPRRRAHYLVERVIDFLENDDEGYRIVMTRVEGNEKLCRRLELKGTNYQGVVDFDDHCIYVDFRREPISTVIHEVIHILYRKMKETDVRRNERLAMRHITDDQVAAIWALTTVKMLDDQQSSED